MDAMRAEGEAVAHRRLSEQAFQAAFAREGDLSIDAAITFAFGKDADSAPARAVQGDVTTDPSRA